MLSRQAQLGRRPAGPAARSLSVAAVALCTAAVLLLAGCGEGDDGPGDGQATVSLAVTLDVDGNGGEPARQADVLCPGDGACDVAERLTPADFEPVSPDRACTEIFGGPEVATVEGTLDAQEVSATFNRANGCEIDRFGAIVPLLQELFPGYRPGASLEP